MKRIAAALLASFALAIAASAPVLPRAHAATRGTRPHRPACGDVQLDLGRIANSPAYGSQTIGEVYVWYTCSSGTHTQIYHNYGGNGQYAQVHMSLGTVYQSPAQSVDSYGYGDNRVFDSPNLPTSSGYTYQSCGGIQDPFHAGDNGQACYNFVPSP